MTILYLTAGIPSSSRVAEHLRAVGHAVHEARNLQDALRAVLEEEVEALLLDGGALSALAERSVRQWREADPLLAVIGVAYKDPTEPALLRADCRAILKQPVQLPKLDAAIEDAARHRQARIALGGGDDRMARLTLRSVLALVSAVELKDAYTRGRADRVALFAGIIADEVPGVDRDLVRLAARIHDVGKMNVPAAVLNKTDRLSDAEFELVKQHPIDSWELLRRMFEEDVILGVARHHHERWDGAGYPDGIAGDEIPLPARIVAIADSLDAITSTRAFRQARLWTEAVKEIEAGSGSRYDPKLVKVFSGVEERLLLGK